MPEKPKVKTAKWIPWSAPPSCRVHDPAEHDGGWLLTLGEPDDRVAIGRQIQGIPTLSREEAEAIATALNAIPAKEPVDG